MTQNPKYFRKISAQEILFLNHPSSNILLVASLNGHIPYQNLKIALELLKKRHVLLRCLIVKHQGEYYFQEREYDQINLDNQVINLQNQSQFRTWIDLCKNSVKNPFDYSKSPPIRIIFCKDFTDNKIILLANHVICDGMALTYLMRDLLIALTSQSLVPLPLAPSMVPDIFPIISPKLNLSTVILKKILEKWEKEKVTFDLEDFSGISNGFWDEITYNIHPLCFNSDQTKKLIQSCRNHDVTINTAIITAVHQAHTQIVGKGQPYYGNISVAANLRPYTHPPIGEHLGLYARGFEITYRFGDNNRFWANAKKMQKRINRKNTTKKMFQPLISLNLFSQSFIEGMIVKLIGKFIPESHERSEKVHRFASREDIVFRMLRKKQMDKLAKEIMITNIGKVSIPSEYSSLTISKLYFIPPSSLTMKYVLGVATINDNLIINFMNYENITPSSELEQLISRTHQILIESLVN